MVNSVVTGADAVAAALEELDVEIAFGITGAGNLAIFDAIFRRGFTRIVFVHHEQAAVMAAQALNRTTGKLGVALVTTGAGSTNALTGIVSANMDSIPILVISGNESSIHTSPDNELRAWGIQGFDSRAVFAHVSKESHRARKPDQIHDLIVNGAHTAMSARAGVVTIDIPMDLQRKSVSHERTAVRRQIARAEAITHVQSDEVVTQSIDATITALKQSSRPVILLGNGMRGQLDRAAVRTIIQDLAIPTILSWSAIDLLQSSHPMNFGRCGIYGDRYANMIVQNADLVISVGSRLAIPQLSYDPADFARNARVIVIDIDPRELEKFVGDRWITAQTDAGEFLRRLGEVGSPSDFSRWVTKANALKETFPRRRQTVAAVPLEERDDWVNSYDVVYEISDKAGPADIFVTDQGTGLLSGYYGLDINDEQRLTSSLGLGEMGFGLPAAVGAQIANPDSTVICLNSDGGMMLNLQELQTIAHHKLPIKLVVFQNDGYLMIKHSQRNLFDGRYVGSDFDSGVSCPDFSKVAETFGFSFLKLEDDDKTGSTVDAFLKMTGPVMLEVVMHPEQLFIPRVGTIKGENGALVSPPLEDMIPLVPEAELSAAMDGALHPESTRLRQTISNLPTMGASS